MKRVSCTALFGLILLGMAQAPRADYDELTLKAMFLDATTRFITWPDSTDANLPVFSDTSQPFIIGVMGEDSIVHVLKSTFARKSIRSKAVDVRVITGVSEIPLCHMLYIPAAMRKNLEIILPVAQDRPILTVADVAVFAEQGVILTLYLEGSKVRFKINETAARQSGLKISYHLLKMGKVINPVGGAR